MTWYSWLDVPYRQILSHYHNGNGHHAMLLHSYPGNGEASLCYAVSRWLMCRRPNKMKSCGTCHSCQMMIAGHHPDFYRLKKEKKGDPLEIDSIRNLIHSIYTCAHQSNVKVIWFPSAEQLTHQAVNALLKILEEPPEKTYFILSCERPLCLLSTLRSRCIYWNIPSPKEELGISWLYQQGYKEITLARTALRLCSNAPLAAEKLLQPLFWKMRQELCIALKKTLTKDDFLELFPVLNQDEDNKPLYWLLSFLSDALKWQKGIREFFINLDKQPLIASLAKEWPATAIHIQWQRWLQFLRQLQETRKPNRELLLIYHLLNLSKNTTYM